MIYIYNSLSGKKEIFNPIKGKNVGMYSCGPTVYWYQHIGNFRTMLLNDFLKRTLMYNGFKVKHVMNVTDVDDKTIKGAKKEGLSLKELTGKYEKIFFNDLNELGIIEPNIVLNATDNIDEMVKLVKSLVKKGYAYKTSDGIYFSIDKFKSYGKLAGLDKITQTKTRILADEYDKGNVRDFALWKFWTQEDRDVFWETEIGKGRPGWHIECSAMSMKALGSTFDIHSGGLDLVFPHHTNEIAQSECATGKKFVNYWVHGGMLNMKEGKMSKSLGNIYIIKDIKENGYEPICFRYLCLLTHYRKPLEFSFDALDAAKNAYERLKRKVIEIRKSKNKGGEREQEYEEAFLAAINDDLNMPEAVQVLWKAVDNETFEYSEKLKLLEKFDNVLGLGIKSMKEEKLKIPVDVIKLMNEREKARRDKNWKLADELRSNIRALGYDTEDTLSGVVVKIKK